MRHPVQWLSLCLLSEPYCRRLVAAAGACADVSVRRCQGCTPSSFKATSTTPPWTPWMPDLVDNYHHDFATFGARNNDVEIGGLICAWPSYDSTLFRAAQAGVPISKACCGSRRSVSAYGSSGTVKLPVSLYVVTCTWSAS